MFLIRVRGAGSVMGCRGLVAVALSAVLAGARSYAAIGQWAAELSPEHRRQVGLTRACAPTASAFRRLLQRLDADLLDGLLGAYRWTRTAVVRGRRVIAIDGKTVRGARTSSTSAPHLVAALDYATGTVLGQLATAAKSNEIPTVSALGHVRLVRRWRCCGHGGCDAPPGRDRPSDHRGRR